MSNHKAIPAKNRAQLLDDVLTAARANLLPYDQALEVIKYLTDETDYTPWTAANRALDFIDLMLYGQDDYTEWTVRFPN